MCVRGTSEWKHVIETEITQTETKRKERKAEAEGRREIKQLTLSSF